MSDREPSNADRRIRREVLDLFKDAGGHAGYPSRAPRLDELEYAQLYTFVGRELHRARKRFLAGTSESPRKRRR